MTQKSYFWDSPTDGSAPVGDASLAPYDQDELCKVLMLVSSTGSMTNKGGVIDNYLNELVPATSAGNVTIGTGAALVFGRALINDALVSFTPAAPAVSTRNDRIVARADWTTQTARITKVTGAEGGGVPSLVQTEDTTWDVPLCHYAITTGGVITLVDDREFTDNTVTFPITVPEGGTGLVTALDNGIVYGQGTSQLGVLSPGASHTVLHGNGASPPTMEQVGTDDIATGSVTTSKIADTAVTLAKLAAVVTQLLPKFIVVFDVNGNIETSYNVASVVKNTGGDFTINLTAPFSAAYPSYAVFINIANTNGTPPPNTTNAIDQTSTASAIRVRVDTGNLGHVQVIGYGA